MSLQVPPNGSGTILGTVTITGKDYPQSLISDGVTPNAASVNLVGAPDVLRLNELAVSATRVDGGKATYSAAYAAFSIGTGATTNIFTMPGSASKIIKITKISIYATSTTTAAYFDVLFKKQSTADSGGTAVTAATVVPHDSTSAAASSAGPAAYTAGPTAGTVVGMFKAVKIFAPITGTAAPMQGFTLTAEDLEEALTLRGVAQLIAITVNAVTPGTASSFSISITWTEE